MVDVPDIFADGISKFLKLFHKFPRVCGAHDGYCHIILADRCTVCIAVGGRDHIQQRICLYLIKSLKV